MTSSHDFRPAAWFSVGLLVAEDDAGRVSLGDVEGFWNDVADILEKRHLRLAGTQMTPITQGEFQSRDLVSILKARTPWPDPLSPTTGAVLPPYDELHAAHPATISLSCP